MLLHFRWKLALQTEIVLICTWTVNDTFDSDMHKEPFMRNFSKVHVEKLNHPSHLNDAHYLVVVFFSRQLVISLPVFGGKGKKRKMGRSLHGGRGSPLGSYVQTLQFP